MADMAESDRGQVGNGLDSDVWGDLATWQVAQLGGQPSELDNALDLLGRAQVLLADLLDGDPISPERAAFLHDDIVAAAVAFGWWESAEGEG